MEAASSAGEQGSLLPLLSHKNTFVAMGIVAKRQGEEGFENLSHSQSP